MINSRAIMEFLVFKRLIKEIKYINPKFLKDENNRDAISKLLINKIKLSENLSLASFMIDYLENNEYFENSLWECVELSKGRNDNLLDLLSSNCLSILNYGGKNLSYKDFSNFRIPYADLSESIIFNSKFDNALMTKCMHGCMKGMNAWIH